jgi:cytochrome c
MVTGIIIVIVIFSVAIAIDIANAADPINGKKVFKKCVTCHSLQEGKNKIGPSLYNLLDRKIGSVEGYKYSKAMKNSSVVWDEESLDKFLTKPRKFIPKTKMSFRGIKNKSLRDDLISFFKQL